MNIQYLGQSCFLIKTKNSTIIIDPYSSEIGKKLPKQDAIDLALITHHHADHNDLSNVNDGYFLIDGVGEYDVKNVTVTGITSYHDKKKGQERGLNTIYAIESEGINLCHLGDLGVILEEEQIEKIGSVDILFIPVGGKYTINASDAVKVISQIEPFIVIPMHYDLGFNSSLGLDKLDNFLKEMGTDVPSVKSLKVGKEEFSDESEGSKLVIFDI